MKQIATFLMCIAALLLWPPGELAAQQQPRSGQQGSRGGPSSGQSGSQDSTLMELVRIIEDKQQQIREAESAIAGFDAMKDAVNAMSFEQGQLEELFNTMKKTVEALKKEPALLNNDTRVPEALHAVDRFRNHLVAEFKRLYEKKVVSVDAGVLATSSIATFVRGDASARAELDSVTLSVDTTKELIWEEVLQDCHVKLLFDLDELDYRLRGSIESNVAPTNIGELINSVTASEWKYDEFAEAFESRKSKIQSAIAELRMRRQMERNRIHIELEDTRAARTQLLNTIENGTTPSFYRAGLFGLVCLVIVVLTRVFWQRKCAAPPAAADEAATPVTEDRSAPKSAGLLPELKKPPTQLDLFQSGAFVQVFALVVVMLTIGLLGANQELNWEAVGTVLGTIVGYAFGRGTHPR